MCQRLKISEQIFHRWRNQYGGMKANEAKRLKALEQENTRLKGMVVMASAYMVLRRRELAAVIV